MGRPAQAKNNFYHFCVKLDGEKHYIRTLHGVADHLGLGSATIIRKLKTPEIILRKYKNRDLSIERCKIPIYKIIRTSEEIIY